MDSGYLQYLYSAFASVCFIRGFCSVNLYVMYILTQSIWTPVQHGIVVSVGCCVVTIAKLSDLK